MYMYASYRPKKMLDLDKEQRKKNKTINRKFSIKKLAKMYIYIYTFTCSIDIVLCAENDPKD